MILEDKEQASLQGQEICSLNRGGTSSSPLLTKKVKIMKYYVSVTETLNRVVAVSADSESEAIKKAKDAYCRNEIVLSGDDCLDDSSRFEIENQEDWDEIGGLQHID